MYFQYTKFPRNTTIAYPVLLEIWLRVVLRSGKALSLTTVQFISWEVRLSHPILPPHTPNSSAAEKALRISTFE